MAKIWSLLLSAAERWAFLPLLWVTPLTLPRAILPDETPTHRRESKRASMLCSSTKSRKLNSSMVSSKNQFRMYYEKAVASEGITGEVLLTTIERRLDNVVFRLGFATTRRSARQMVTHGHYTVNGKRVDIASYLVKPGDEIAVCEKSAGNDYFKKLKEDNAFGITPKCLNATPKILKAKLLQCPARDDIDYDVAEHLIVELYSK